MCIPLNVEDQEKSIHSQSAFCTQSAVCILYLVCIWYPVCSLQSAFCTDRSPRCGHFGSSVQVAFLEIRNCSLWLLSLSNPTNILFFSAWISELHRNWFRFLLSGEGQDARLFPLTVCSATSVHDRELPSTSALPQCLIHCFQHEGAKTSNWSDYTCTWRSKNFETFVFIGGWLVICLRFFLLICRLIRFWILHSINHWFLRQRAFIDEARGKFGEHERCVRVARRVAVSNSSFLSAHQTSCVLHRWTHGWRMNQLFYNIFNQMEKFFLEGFVC